MVPVLAGAIAYLDTNHNLDLLACVGDAQDPSRPAWVSQLWLAVLEGVCQLSYRNLRSMSNKEELDEFTVHHTGAGSHLFSARLPFSWLLYEVTETAITGAKNVNGELVLGFHLFFLSASVFSVGYLTFLIVGIYCCRYDE